MNLGDAQILTIPGEALPNIGFYLKRKMHGKHNLLFGLTNDAFGYILTKVDFQSFPRYDYVSRTSLGEMTGEILIEKALGWSRSRRAGSRPAVRGGLGPRSSVIKGGPSPPTKTSARRTLRRLPRPMKRRPPPRKSAAESIKPSQRKPSDRPRPRPALDPRPAARPGRRDGPAIEGENSAQAARSCRDERGSHRGERHPARSAREGRGRCGGPRRAGGDRREEARGPRARPLPQGPSRPGAGRPACS